MTAEKLVVYLDLNVYSRPFDDQTNEKIRRETETINRPRDALHLASAVFGEADYCLTCDSRVAKKSTNRCVKRIAKKFGRPYVSVMNPIQFVEKFFRNGDE